MEQLNYNLLFRWFVGLSMDDPVWVATVFSKNRDRLLDGDIAAAFLSAVLNLPRVKGLLSDEHVSVDGTLIQARASMKSFRRKDGSDEPPSAGRNRERHFHRDKRSNATHASTTDPDARLARKSNGQEAKLAFTGHLLMENRNGLVVDATLTTATGTAEREAALAMVGDLPEGGRITLGGDKAYDTRDFVAEMRRLGVTPHVSQNTNGRRSAIDGRTTRHATRRLCRQRARSQAHRGGVRLDQDRRRAAQDPSSRHRPGGLDVRLRRGRLQLGAYPQASGWRGVDQARTPSAAMTFARQHSRNRQNRHSKPRSAAESFR